ncbi:MAG TPA: hypothetical protein VFN61_13325 [Acidimicrobiales bacterium]|nr:hypothetical protein [Acidimicrobiales bacterium]
MFKRVTWMSMGLVAGLGASKWLERKARRRIARLFPVHQLPVRAGTELVARARDEAKERAAEIREAVEVGKAARLERENDLRDRIYGRGGPGPDGGNGWGHRGGTALGGAPSDDVVVELRRVTSSSPRPSLPSSSPGRRTRRRRAPGR